ncbi:hypothetical protein Bca52824_063878 [Brassica carinata]|uniref:Uncharacterized protein n=1 Tax=Brassica carinata TaxID=52824 RepID=A0A8X7QGW8_BRACI|nr:hypothetical protein Bca52824_063878 [Brassica carinata]
MRSMGEVVETMISRGKSTTVLTESSLVAAENGCDVSGRRDASSSSLSNSIESLRTIFWALMSDAMILPCGHTFGAGGME